MNNLNDKTKDELIAIIIGCSKSIKHLKRNRKWRFKCWLTEKKLMEEQLNIKDELLRPYENLRFTPNHRP